MAIIGFAVGLDGEAFRLAAAVVMIALGLLLAAPPLQVRLAAAGGPVSNWVESRWGNFDGPRRRQPSAARRRGPCVGPTLGAASVLAAQGQSLGVVAATMALFGIGAGLPLALLGLVSRQAMNRWRDRLIGGGKGMKIAFGLLFVVIGLSIVTGLDKRIETTLVQISPDWLTAVQERHSLLASPS